MSEEADTVFDFGPSDALNQNLQKIKEMNKDPNLEDTIQHCINLVKKLDIYLDDTCPPATSLQKKIWNDHFNEPWKVNFQKGIIPFKYNPLRMITGHYAGQYLRMMADLCKSKRILEIGLLSGYSAVSFAESAHCEELIALEIVPYMVDFAKARIANTPAGDKIRIITGDASNSLIQLKHEGKKFDMVFIDADKGGYINYYKYIMDNDLLENTGVMLCDNVLWRSDPYMDKTSEEGKALYEFVQFVKNDDRVTQIICPVRDGILMIKPKMQNL